MKFSIITSSYNQLANLKRIKSYWDNQTLKDFEWVIADDGSTDGTLEWATKKGIAIYHKEKNTGYGLTDCLNKSAQIAKGQFLVFVMGDTYPKRDFLEQIDKLIDERTLVNGLRFEIDWETGEVVKPEWRTWINAQFPWWTANSFMAVLREVPNMPNEYYPAWRLVTLNSLAMPKKLWDKMGGLPTDFDGYGKMDWYIGAWMLFNGYDVTMATKAIVYHRLHEDRKDSDNANKVFEKYLRQFILEAEQKKV